jgi:sugar phosphate isomerase/epimerase
MLAHAWGAAADSYMKTLGLQLYTLRNQMAEKPNATLLKVAEAGYKQVELMDVTAAPSLVPLAKEHGMTVTSSFMNWALLGMAQPPKDAGTVEQCIDLAAKNGLKYLVFGYVGKGNRETPDHYKGIAERSNKAGELCKKSGIQLCYHHHSFEFEPLAGGKCGMDYLIESFDHSLVPFEIDVFWAALGGWDPIETLKKLKGRVVQVHLKDLKPEVPTIYDEGKVPKEAFKEVGAGRIAMKPILDVCHEIGVAQCHVEQDQSPDPLDSVQKSIRHLQVG